MQNKNVAFALVIKALVMVFGLLGLANMWMAVFADTGVAGDLYSECNPHSV
nr:hypothetical protein [Mediterraneibacter gnavus]